MFAPISDDLIDTTVELPAIKGRGAVKHVFEEADIYAVNVALAAERPLLIRGEPGIGKSQLARAAAFALDRAFVSKVIDARAEARDLKYGYDAVRRLAVAQVEGAKKEPDLEQLNELNFVTPGPLWWAFHWDSAYAQASPQESLPDGKKSGATKTQVTVPWHPEKWTSDAGVVLLLDEIDKADASVPNGLLEALGDGQFDVEGRIEPVTTFGVRPLVVVTTNEERSLPNAFLRRCMVHEMKLPDTLESWLIKRGQEHFGDTVDAEARKIAAKLLAEDRQAMQDRGLTPPGQAEYLDMLRALARLGKDPKHQRDLVNKLQTYAFQKHPSKSVG